jgi:hypothetical protein
MHITSLDDMEYAKVNNLVLKISFFINYSCENIANKTTTLYLKTCIFSSKKPKFKLIKNAGYTKPTFDLYNNQQLEINSNI